MLASIRSRSIDYGGKRGRGFAARFWISLVIADSCWKTSLGFCWVEPKEREKLRLTTLPVGCLAGVLVAVTMLFGVGAGSKVR